MSRRREAFVGRHIVKVADTDTGSAPDDALHRQDARALVLGALDRIPLAKRAVLLMYDVDEVPMREVASALEIPLFTAYGRLRTARHDFAAAIRRLLIIDAATSEAASAAGAADSLRREEPLDRSRATDGDAHPSRPHAVTRFHGAGQ